MDRELVDVLGHCLDYLKAGRDDVVASTLEVNAKHETLLAIDDLSRRLRKLIERYGKEDS